MKYFDLYCSCGLCAAECDFIVLSVIFVSIFVILFLYDEILFYIEKSVTSVHAQIPHGTS